MDRKAESALVDRVIDVPTKHTLSFVRAHLPPKVRRILEVGCGRGYLAERLQNSGYTVVGIDINGDSINDARNRGVDALAVDWLDFHEAPYDAIIFSRSLHHISPLDDAIAHALTLTNAAGTLLIEDFAFDEIDVTTAEWFRSTLALLCSTGSIKLKPESFLSLLLDAEQPADAWRQGHLHEPPIHSASAVVSALKRCFPICKEWHVPYLYRYFDECLEGTQTGLAVMTELLAQEDRLIRAEAILLLGRRYVARSST